MKYYLTFLFICILITFTTWESLAQLSPGELASAHSKLEGLSNCTACHELGNKVTSAKCMDCHKEIKSMIDQKKGYHSSDDVKGKECFACHSDHHGLNFQIIRIDTLKFNHHLTGYELKGKHAKISCTSCHKKEFIKTKISQRKGKSYLGLDTKCITCHVDYHQKTLSTDCASCHGTDAFKPAPGFKHQTTKFPLIGKHSDVTCIKCHQKEKKDGRDFQRFSGIEFKNCTACHKDVHENKFGNDCRKCHSEESFHQIAGVKTFDHSKTDYPLIGKHQSVDCKKCHKGPSYTTHMKFARCADCHTDYHKGQFSKNAAAADCKDCHSENGFAGTSFSFERHNKSNFKLEGAHVATPCLSCHKKEKDWQFGEMDKRCVACHENIHKNHIKEKFIPEGRCENCHLTDNWTKVTFDHKTTSFELKGKHVERSCRDCHFKKDKEDQIAQKFSELTGQCEECHTDIHQKQFGTNGVTDCTTCHGVENWKAEKFNHDLTRFKLDGGHKGVECKKCHFENKSNTVPFIQYKNTKMLCISCHT